MRNRSQLGYLLLALVAAAGMWAYVQCVLVAHQRADALVTQRPRGNLSDLYPRWLGARELLLRGRDPYSSDLTREIQIGYYGRLLDSNRPGDPRDEQAFAYPVYVVFMLAPTVGLPFPIVQKLVFWFFLGITAASVLAWLRFLKLRISITNQLVWVVLVTSCYPAIQGYRLRQLSILVAALVAFAASAMARQQFVRAGVLLALATIKPQLVGLLILWLFIWVASNWRVRKPLLVSFGISMIVLGGAGEFLLPGWISEFHAALTAYYRYTGGTSILDLALPAPWGKLLAAIVVIGLFVFLYPMREFAEGTSQFQWALSVVLATTLIVIPTFGPYNQLLLIPAIMLVVRSIRGLWEKRGFHRFLVILTGVSVLWPFAVGLFLVAALAFLPGQTVERAWAVLFYTTLVTPIAICALAVFAARAAHSQPPNSSSSPSGTESPMHVSD